MREIVLDTETTGMDPDQGDRIIEIGCVELVNHVPTGKHLQLYINPERDIPAEATAVHGITNDFVKDKPVFSQVYEEFMAFVKDAKLVIHNAEFDMKFINWELKKVGHAPIGWNHVIDTLAIARKAFPGSPANLDALCRRFGIDNTERTYHGALLDSELLAEVYLELLGGRQHGLSLLSGGSASDNTAQSGAQKERPYREPRGFKIADEELAAHAELLEKISDPLWKKLG
ncbi:MAG: DNA polymerase III subunit epsilon [Alphaproteobacteria bacterium]